jgi:hypothetical protein
MTDAAAGLALADHACHRTSVPSSSALSASGLTMLKSPARWLVVIALGALVSPTLPACLSLANSAGDDDDDDDDSERGPTCQEPRAVACEDEVFVALNMSLDQQAPGLITSTVVDGVFEVEVDATAGGFGGGQGFVYGRFTDEGLLRVDLADIDSLGSMEWDIAFRRFVIRVNSGYGGPSCVTAARTAADTDFDGLDAVPEGLRFNEESFMSDPDTCTVIADGSGVGSPGVVLQNWWTYPDCVATTGNVYVLSLANGRRIKLMVTQYYAGDGAQDACNEPPHTSAGESGRIKLRYAFLD